MQAESPAPVPPVPWFTEGFYFTRNPSVLKSRAIYFKILGLFCLLLTVSIFTIIAIYWAALWHSPDKVHNLRGWILDFDGGELGAYVSQSVLATNGPKTSMTWVQVPISHFPNGQPDVIEAIAEHRAWTIIAINPGATSALNAAVTSANFSYNGSLAITAYTAEARSENAYRSYIRPKVTGILTNTTQQFNIHFVNELVNTGTNLTALAAAAPRLFTQPTNYIIDNVRPFDIPTASAVDFVGLIYLLILAFVFTMANWAGLVSVTQFNDRLTFRSLMLTRIFKPIIGYFFITLFYGLLSVAFQVPFDRKFGHSGFLVYWMLSWFAMAGLGLALESMITILTPTFVPFFLLLWLIANVSVCYWPPQLLPGIFHYAYAMPFYNVQQGVRTILFNTKNQLGLNFGVQLAWISVSLVTLTTFQWYARQKSVRAYEQALAVPVSDEKKQST
ncbi:hypothetical protein FA95DRAFT_1667828 [Auriscalpium vulgare]|uniref:Uncharacterized protein n=1 Tax=Auriscalpium vulgare TaxID=40419 RepID=A0ACB8RSE0_9AGAM|nr:hypothetical protein FA95DRAFT_1667828 [Auriscalpium vulgare]